MGFLSDVFGTLTGQRQQEQANAANRARLEEALLRLGVSKEQASAIADQQISLLEGAKRDTNLSGLGTKQAILDQGVAAQDAATSQLVRSGLINSTAQTGVRRGVAADTSRRLLELDSTIANRNAGLTVGQSNVLGGLLGTQTQLDLAGVNALIGVQEKAAPGILQALGGAPGIASLFSGGSTLLGKLGSTSTPKLFPPKGGIF